MPCRCDGYDGSGSEMHGPTTFSKKEIEADEKERKKMIAKLDQLTAMLCFVANHAKFDVAAKNKPEWKTFADWAKKHKEFDKQRLDTAKRSALAKLTTEEKEALGL